MLITGALVKSSKKMCGVPEGSMTMSENCAVASAPLTSEGTLKGQPGPAEWDSRITEPKAGMVALPSVQVPMGRLQKKVEKTKVVPGGGLLGCAWVNLT